MGASRRVVRISWTAFAIAGGACAAAPAGEPRATPSTTPKPEPVASEKVSAAVPDAGSDASPVAAMEPGATADFHCNVQSEALGAEVVGEAKGGGKSADPIDDRAWKKVCAELKKKFQRDCEDRDQLSLSRFQKAEYKNSVGSYEVVYKLRPVVAVVEGSGASPTDLRNACIAAHADACSKAPAGATCDATHVGCRTKPAVARTTTCVPIRRLAKMIDEPWFRIAEPPPLDFDWK